MRPEVGILTWHQYDNFGSMLQAYALHKSIEKLGYGCEIVDYYDLNTIPAPGNLDKVKFYVKKMLATLGLNRFVDSYYSFQHFYYDRLCKSSVVTDREGLRAVAEKYRCLVFGSDQIWAPNVYNPVYMGDFVENEKVRLISYAASVGLNNIPDELRPVYSKLLSRFSRIAVREEMGKKLLKEQCDIEAEVVLDPTLLLDTVEYRNMQKPNEQITEPYIFCYFLNKDHHYRARVEKFAQKHGYKIYGVSLCARDDAWMKLLPATGPEEFLWLVDHAQVVFTDSYHGTIFSLQFQKVFWTFERFSREDPVNQNSRIQQLDLYFGIGDRFLPPDKDVDESCTLDYGPVVEKLHSNREKSFSYLREALR